MLDRLNAWSPVLLLGALALLTWWLDAQVARDTARRDGSTRHDPDLYIENFRAESYDAAGELRQSLSAAKALHHPDDDSIDFVNPTLALTDPGKPRLTITADTGMLTGDHETVIVRGKVRGVRDQVPPATPGGRPEGPVTLATEEMRVVPRKGLASTTAPVTIQDPRGIIRATGMDLDNNARTVKFHADVRGTLQPHTLPK